MVDGTLAGSDEETHHRSEPQVFDLDEVAAALARRRTGGMASDHARDLTIVHRLATEHTLAELDAARQPLRQLLSTAPRDLSAVLERTMTDLESLQARRRRLRLPEAASELEERRIEAIDRAIVRIGRRFDAAQRQDAERQRWLDEHAEVIERYDSLVRAAAQRRAKNTADPERYL